MSDDAGILWGEKAIAEHLDCSVRSLRNHSRLSRDPLRLAKLGARVWAYADRTAAWQQRRYNAHLAPIVEGWLSIAKVLGTEVRTAQRWSQLQRDPVPVEQRKNRTVYAYRYALLDWLEAQAQRCKCSTKDAA